MSGEIAHDGLGHGAGGLGVVNDGSTAPERATTGGLTTDPAVGAQKLAALLGKGTPPASARRSAPPAHIPSAQSGARPAAPPPGGSEPKVDPLEARRRELSDPTNAEGIFSADPAKQRAAVAELNRVLAGQMSEDDRQALVDSPVTELRQRYGVDHDQVLAPFRERRDEGAEQVTLQAFAQEGVSAEAVGEILTWYTGVFNGAGGLAENLNADQVEAEFRAIAKKHGLPAGLVENLVTYHRARA
jgi:hypothetical protein